MRVVAFVKSTPEIEAGAAESDEQMLIEMGKCNEELVKAGVMLAGEGLHPSSEGARVVWKGGEITVVDGPFTEAKELVAGYWLWQVKSMDEAIEWARRCPNPTGEDSVIELRQVFEAEDFGEAYTPEVAEQERRTRAIVEGPEG
jgi:hypothetical protein